MKRFVAILILVCAGLVYAQLQPVIPYDVMAQRTDPGQVYTANNAWVVVDTTTSAGTEPTDLGVTERTYITVAAAIAADVAGDGEISIYGDGASERLEISNWNGIRVRASGITDDGTCTYQVYSGTLVVGATDCELAKIGQLAFVIGTQASITSTYEMADAVTATESDSVSAWSTVGAASNTVAEAQIDLNGANIIVLVPTVVTANCRLHVKGF